MSRVAAWLEQAAAANQDCPSCGQMRALVARIIDTHRVVEDRFVSARVSELERELAATRKQLDAVRRRRGAA